ncbi:hypothetical protein VU04_07335 [Desulfobulbus sp. TB]|nr:hypothetical protein [Desulfobulbus sp. TB]
MNDWCFSREEIFQVVGAVAQAGVEAIEVGYISDQVDKPLAARCEADLLHELHEHIDGVSKLAVMLSLTEVDPVSLLASRAKQIDLLRLPSTFEQLPIALLVAEQARKLDIACSLNLVNISTLERENFLYIAREVKNSGLIDIFYLADSRGACRPDDVFRMVSTIREVWEGRFGFHAHDNTGLAADNSLRALDAGCQLIDATVNGLGLGSGNTNLSHALNMVKKRCPDKQYNIEALDTVSTLQVPIPTGKKNIYQMVGEKNFAQLWVDPLIERYGDNTEQLLQGIPRRPYTDIQQIFDEIDA